MFKSREGEYFKCQKEFPFFTPLIKEYMNHSHRYTIQELTTKLGCATTASRELLSLFNSAWLCTALPVCSPWALHQYMSEDQKYSHAKFHFERKGSKNSRSVFGLIWGSHWNCAGKDHSPKLPGTGQCPCLLVT